MQVRNLSVVLLCAASAWMVCANVEAQALLPGTGLEDLPLLSKAETRMVSPENPTGEKGKGAMAIPNPDDPNLPFSSNAVDLGQGWKVSPFIKMQPKQTAEIMNVEGPGIIQHIWLVVTPGQYPDLRRRWEDLRGAVLRIYWDGEATPSVEVPVTDFFAIGHTKIASVNSLPVVVNQKSALNAFWPMPFRKSARMTLTNDNDNELPLVTYQITYAMTPIPENAGYFHAQWRRTTTDRAHPEHTILDGVKGHGRYVGTVLSWQQQSDGWSGEGEVKFYMDGDGKFPTIVGTGLEDYFGASFGFPERYSTPFLGNPFRSGPADGPDVAGPKWPLYRWHIMDPINFQKDLKVTLQALGWWPNKRYQPLSDDIASVAFWYQTEPHAAFPKLPSLTERWPR